MDLGANLKKAREAAGITQKALAEELGVQQVIISRWEGNKRTPSATTFGDICRALGASADDILELNK